MRRKACYLVVAALYREDSLHYIIIPAKQCAKQCTLHIRVVLSKKLNLHFLFLMCSLGYNNEGFSSKTCFLNIEKIFEEIV